MKKFSISGFIASLLSLAVSLLLRVVAFVKESFMPKRDFRLDGFKQNITSRISAVASQAKVWMYAMFSRWHVDSYTIA